MLMANIGLKDNCELIVIGASTGGPSVLEYILTNMEPLPNVAIVIVQHMPEIFTQSFVKRLSRITNHNITQINQDEEILKGHVYMIPGDYNAIIVEEGGKKFAKLNKDSLYSSCKPSIDLVMITAAEIYKERLAGIILSGMGEDGMLGAMEISKYGGRVYAQDPEEATISSMPKTVIDVGIVDDILTKDKIVEKIKKLSI